LPKSYKSDVGVASYVMKFTLIFMKTRPIFQKFKWKAGINKPRRHFKVCHPRFACN